MEGPCCISSRRHQLTPARRQSNLYPQSASNAHPNPETNTRWFGIELQFNAPVTRVANGRDMIRQFGDPTLEVSTIEPGRFGWRNSSGRKFSPPPKSILFINSSTRPLNYFSQVSVVILLAGGRIPNLLLHLWLEVTVCTVGTFV